MRRDTLRLRKRAASKAILFRAEALEVRRLLSAFMVTNTGDNGGNDPAAGAGTGTLRQAIIDADASSSASNTINFNIPGSGVQTISLATELPVILTSTTINGYSQPNSSVNTLSVGDNAVILIAVNGSSSNGDFGLNFQAGNSSVSGLSIGGFIGYGINVGLGASNVTISGNFVGLDPGGIDLGNGLDGIVTSAPNTIIGGSTPAARNVIAANSPTDINLGANATANIYATNTGLIVQGNYIGTDPTGSFARGYADPIDGIDLAGSAANNMTAQGALIGGSSASAANVINTWGDGDPISVTGGASNEVIQGNLIGVNAADTAAVSGGSYGIYLDSSSNNTVGGPSAGDGNVIGSAGIAITIAGVSNGVLGAAASGNVVQGNYLGVNPAGTSTFQNGGGIEIHGASGNLIGGTSPGQGNTIEDNGYDAINILGGDDFHGNLLAAANDNQIVGNSIFNNGGLGIDLEQGPLDDQSGVTTPTAGTHIAGSNNLQNQPTLSSANIVSGQLQFSGNFLSDTASGSKLKLDVYVSNSASSTINAQGQTYVGETTLTSGTGTVNFGPLNFNGGSLFQYVSATLTDASGNTSEFSTPILIGNPFLVTNTNDSGNGSLRQAIIASDSISSSQPNVIQFAIPGGGVQTIAPLTPLPTILEPTVIDGYSQPGSTPNTSTTSDNANLEINFSGANLTSGGYGLYISGSAASGSTIKGLAINGFTAGVVVDKSANGNSIVGNFIGTNVAGTTAAANATYGVEVQTANNIIGGTTSAAANLISGNNSNGVFIDGTSANSNTIQGNYIGTNAANTAALSNLGSGVAILDGPLHNLIGGTSTGAANVIDDNVRGGVYAASYSGFGSVFNTIVGNSIYNNDLTAFGYRGIELLGSPPASIPGNSGITLPVLASAVYQSNALTLKGSFVGTGAGTLSLDVYLNHNLDQNDSGEGQIYLGRYTVNNGSGTVSLGPIQIPGSFTLGDFITATFTDSNGNTSEFSTPAPIVSAAGQSTFVVTNTNDSGAGSLRNAIIQANLNTASASTINFDIPGSGVQTIQPLTELPELVQPVTINGYSQPGSSPNTLSVGDNAVLLIDINGGKSAQGNDCFDVLAGNCDFSGLVINGFQPIPAMSGGLPSGGNAISTWPQYSNITITGDFIGTDATGSTAVPNGYGIQEDSANDTIGGLAPADRNVLAGNQVVDLASASSGEVIQGNYIGIDATGMKDLSKDDSGALVLTATSGGTIDTTSTNTLVGGNTAAARNVIASDNVCIDMLAGAGDATIQGNYIGVNALATAAFGDNYGISLITAANDTIGGAAAGDGNVIGGSLGNAGIGVLREINNTIGPDATGNVIQGNWIGISPSGTALSNLDGIDFQGTSNNIVGGTGAGEGNVIADNTGNGVDVQGTSLTGGASLTTATGDSIIGNSIYNNTGLGILLGEGASQQQAGITPQTPGVHTSGSNNLQNLPIITFANIVAGKLQMSGNFLSDTPAGTTLKLDVYVSDNFNASGYGPGQTFVGEVTVTSGTGTVNFGPLNFTGGAIGQFVSATLTDASGNTSEFSNALYIGDPYVVTNTNDSGFGSLRQAIINANEFPPTPGGDLIHFAIPGSGVQSINLTSALPDITANVIIDGYTQAGSSLNTSTSGDNAVLTVELNGSAAGAATGLVFGPGSDGSIVEGLDINQFQSAGIQQTFGAGNGLVIVGNFIGTDPTGTTVLGNAADGILLVTANNEVGGPISADANLISGNGDNGVLIYQTAALDLGQQYGVFIDSAPGNIIGGTTPADRNLISANATGIEISGTGATGNLVEGNYIGTIANGIAAPTGFFSFSAQGTGVDIETAGNTIGGTTAAAQNLISGNTNEIILNPTGATGDLVEGNYIGINAAGTAVLGGGMALYGPNNTIGGTAPGAGNVIATITIDGPGNGENSSGNIIQGNYIGIDATGTQSLVGGGITIYSSPNNLIGGTTAAARNIIQTIGIDQTDSINNEVQGNYIGINAAGTAALVGGTGFGIGMEGAGSNLIGGTAPGDGNVISGNGGANISIQGLGETTGETIQGNIIGLDATGTYSIGGGGIELRSTYNALIGGTTAGARNIISGNSNQGYGISVLLGGTGNVIEGNYIGTDITGTIAIPNGLGIDLFGSPDTIIGGTNPGDGNLIENNTGYGVKVGITLGTPSIGSVIEGNSIFANGNLGIELDGYDPTAAPVAGNATNIPVIVSAIAGVSTTNVEVKLDDAPSQAYRVEFFSNPAVDPSGFGQGQVYLGFANVTTDGSGNADKTVTLSVSVPAGRFITATVTGTAGTIGTSEFSAATQVDAVPVVTLNPISQTLTAGQDASFTAAAGGFPDATVQWMVELAGGSKFNAITGATSDTLDLGPAALTETGNKYEAVFTNGVGSPATTTAATLTVQTAPVVTTNPLSQTLTVGQNATFTAAATGVPADTVQWMIEFSGSGTFTPITGATSDTLNLGAATHAESGNQYEAVFSNGVGSPATTTAATLTVNLAQAAPAVIAGPVSQTLIVGQDVSFTAAATGDPTPTVQWMVELSGGSSFASISGATSDTLDLGAATLAESGNKYEAVFTNGVGSPATSTQATLTVHAPPEIQTDPISQTLTVGQDASFTAAASGTPTPTVQWMVELAGGSTFSPLTGQTSLTLDLGASVLTENGNKYEAVFSNGFGSPATTDPATLTVQAPPAVITNPLSQSVVVGQDVTFTAAAGGNPTPTVQWMVELAGGTSFSPITGATSDTLDLGASALTETGNRYEAVFSNGVGSPATTSVATLTVNPAPASPVIITNPSSQSLLSGQDASFTASATGTPAPTVQWYVELAGASTFSKITGATSTTLDLGPATLAESGNQYEAIFSNGVGSPATTTAAMLTVNSAPAAPVVTTNPMSQSLVVGQDAVFTAAATGYPAPTVEWMVQLAGTNTFTAITGAMSDTLDVGVVTLGESGNEYEAVFHNGSGPDATTAAATLTVNPAPASPVVLTNPTSQTLVVGQDASFTASAGGTPSPTVQWYVKAAGGSTFVKITGATSTTLDLGAATLVENGNQYEAIFSNGVGSPATTTAATLTVNSAPAAPIVSTNPTNQTVVVGQNATFTAAASGYPTPTVQWMVELAGSNTFTTITGATFDTLVVGPLALTDSGNLYEAVFHNGSGPDATTSAAMVTVNPAPASPVVLTNPISQTLTVGDDAGFTASAGGTPTPTVQWYVEQAGSSTFSKIGGATSTTLDLGPATLGESGNQYEAIFSNGVGSPATTSAATLTVNPAPAAPVVSTSPSDQTVYVGQNATFTAAATGYPTPTVQWMVELVGSNTFTMITGATSDTLIVGPTALTDSGNLYEAVFHNGSGPDATTSAAMLTVNAAPLLPVIATPTAGPVNAVPNVSTGPVILATFTDPVGAGPVSTYSVTINWNDGSSPSVGTVTFNSTTQVFSVTGSHTYAAAGIVSAPTITVVRDTVSATVTDTSKVTVKLDSVHATAGTLSGYEGRLISGTIATFTDSYAGATAAQFAATINWGDGSTSAGTIISNGGGKFSVTGSHMYGEESIWPYTAKVTITSAGGVHATVASSVRVNSSPLDEVAAITGITVRAGVAFSGKLLATFRDQDSLNDDSTDYSGTIRWGDGTSSNPSFNRTWQTYNVGTYWQLLGSHTYSRKGTYIVTITFQDNGNRSVYLPSTLTLKITVT